MVAPAAKTRFVRELERIQAAANKASEDLAGGGPVAEAAARSLEKLQADMTAAERACPVEDDAAGRLCDATISAVWEAKQAALALGFRLHVPRHAGSLTPFDEEVAAIRAGGATLDECAEQLEKSKKTVQRALAKPATRKLVEAHRRLAAGAAVALFVARTREAAEKVLDIMRTGTRADEIKLKAALAVIELANRRDNTDPEAANETIASLTPEDDEQ